PDARRSSAGGAGSGRPCVDRCALCRRAVHRHAPRRPLRSAAGPRALSGGRRAGCGQRDALMPLDFLLDRFDEIPATRALADALPGAGRRTPLAGLPGSSPAVLVAVLLRRHPQRVIAVVAATPPDAERWLADLRLLVGDAAVLYPQREALGAEEPHFEIAGERVETLADLVAGRVRVLLTTARASAERTGVPATL